MKFLADNGGLQALIQAIKDMFALFDRAKQDKLIAGTGITINNRTISSNGEPNVQADWDMATSSAASYIRNKPDIYTKREIDSMFSATITFVRVNELPAMGTHGTVYLVPKQGAGISDIYDEYLWLSASGSVEAHYELIGSTSVDLSNYYTQSQTNTLLDDKVDKVNGKGLSTEDYTTAEKNKLSGIEAGAKVNVQSDWNQGDSTKDDFIKNKPTLRQPSTDGTSGQYLKSNGNGNAPSWETMDTAPTENSTKAVTSGGVKTALDGKQASISITTKTDDAGDNDKVILQANGVTDTTTFVRRSLTNIRDWLLQKLIPEELLKWGGLNGQGERTALGVIDSTLINNTRANRVAWLTTDHFTVEYSRDGGTTWQNSRHIDDILNWTSSPTGTNIYIGDADAEHIATSAYMTRITLTTAPSPASSNNYTFYCKIVKMCFYVATMGSTGCKLNVYLRTQANIESNTDTWVHVAEDCILTGWSGWNIINFPSGITTYGNNKSAQYGQIRMVFSVDGYSGNGTTNYGLSLQRLRVYAPDCWGVSNSLANYDSPFTFYSDKHIVFPSTVTATKLIKSGGTDSQLLVADGSVISMPIAIAKGGTGATTAFKAEYNINTQVRNNHLTGDISDSSRLAFCSTAPSTTNGVFAGYRTMSQVWTWIKTHFDTSPTSGSGNGITSGGVYSALGDYFPLAGKKAITGVYKNAPSFIHNVDFGNTSTEGVWRKFCVISTRQTYRNAVGEIHINARSTQGTIYLTIGSSSTLPPEGENNTLSPFVKYLSLYNDYRPVYWRVNDDNELELWWKATQPYDSFGVTGVNFNPYFLSLDSAYNAGVNVQWTNVVSLEAPANLSQARDVALTTLDVSAGDVLTIDGDNYKDYLRTPSDGIPTSVPEADRIVLPRAYSTIFFNTTNTATISYIRGASNSNVQKNGRRLTIAGNWKPREESSGDGRFTQYLYKYRGGSVGASQFTDCLREAYEDFVYFNGIWYSKGY